ncbi:MAG: DUF2878 domain-containing protein [Woeseiaceae bacterium]|nr:DUF2878 domain-containing protein [Woeseiaceae bacterium]
MKSLIINLTLFKAGWMAAVFSAAASLPLIGAATVAVVAAIHVARSEHRRSELMLLGMAALFGIVWESLLVQAGVVSYSTGILAPGMAPYWIVAMWVLFATTLNVGMRWLRRSPVIAAIAGGLGGPMSFLAGEKAGAVNFAEPVAALIIIGAGWAIMLPMLVRYAVEFEERAASPALVHLAEES